MQRSNGFNRVSAMLLMGVLALAGAGCGKSKGQLDAEEAARQKAIALAVAEQQRADRESRQAVLADAQKAFDATQSAGSNTPECPSTFSGLRQRDVPAIASCQPIHKDACREVCGARYDTLEVRSFSQTGRNSGLLCQDPSMEPMKNGVSFVADPGRTSCLEVHQGVFKWCTNYNKSAGGIDFGAFVQCQGQIAQ